MPKEFFKIDLVDMKALEETYEKAPRLIRMASSRVLNNMAFNMKKTFIPEVLKEEFNIRARGFIMSSIRYQTTRGNLPVDKQESAAGMIRKDRFSGLVEQQTGAKATRKSVFSKFARGGNWDKKVKRKYRADRRDAITRRKYRNKLRGIKGEQRRNQVWLIQMFRKGEDRPFMLRKDFKTRKGKTMGRGIYIIQGGKIHRIKDLDPKTTQPRRNRWLTKSVALMRRRFNIQNSWAKQIQKILKLR